MALRRLSCILLSIYAVIALVTSQQTSTGTAGKCRYFGFEFSDKAIFWAIDGCNNCSCNSGNVVCTLKLCPGVCSQAGISYKEGDIFPSQYGCGSCVCHKGTVKCDYVTTCADFTPPGLQALVSEPCTSGEVFSDRGECNICECQEDGIAFCTLLVCEGCWQALVQYKEGDTFPSKYPCGDCVCNKDSVKCDFSKCDFNGRYKKQCFDKGKPYRHGQTVPSTKRCERRVCQNGRVQCKKVRC
ncbi:kielin/chordin-like protein [Dreissena polymorpha]|uniref:kielin/chordin-like protein n=1 Tax=Dreissena polymorpha TaxID=45954 RepID=UPI0022644727|nr:kielin/chordin-like protein [Dreissena polymorpha]XP_052255713.1 kielin/chordin-like protein [Dreissena polymorpha]